MNVYLSFAFKTLMCYSAAIHLLLLKFYQPKNQIYSLV